MKINSRFAGNLIALGVLLTAQAVFLFILPFNQVVLFTRVRPMIYIAVVTTHFVLIGRDERPIPKGGQSVLIGVIGIVIYFAGVLITGILFGFGKNKMTPGFSAVLNNIWIYAIAAFLSELLRFRMIKCTPSNKRVTIAIVLTIVYAFVQLDVLRSVSNASFSRNVDIFFASVLPVLTLNAVLSYMAFESSLLTLIIIRSVYSLNPIFLPIVPKTSDSIWATISCGLLIVTVIFYYRNMNLRSRRFRRIVARRAKYQKKSVLAFIVPTAMIAFLIAFSLRAFAYYPVVIPTGSMTGAIDRGSIVFVEKLSSKDVYSTVNEGDIVHYKYRSIEMMHRVIEISYNVSGERAYITKGDANPVADSGLLEMDDVLGISRVYIPYIGYPFVIVKALFGR